MSAAAVHFDESWASWATKRDKESKEFAVLQHYTEKALEAGRPEVVPRNKGDLQAVRCMIDAGFSHEDLHAIIDQVFDVHRGFYKNGVASVNRIFNAFRGKWVAECLLAEANQRITPNEVDYTEEIASFGFGGFSVALTRHAQAS